MESYNPERFSTLVPHRYSGFLHRAGQLFTDADFGVKIQNVDSEEDLNHSSLTLALCSRIPELHLQLRIKFDF